MVKMDKDLEELLFSDVPDEPIEVHLKDIAAQISEMEQEKKEHPDDIAIDITLRSLRQLQEGYLALAKEEGEDALSVPEIRQWASDTKEREPEMAAVGA